jgi:hypothetical protein
MLPIVFPEPISQALADAPLSAVHIDLDDLLWRDLREARLARDLGNIHDLQHHLLRLSALEPPQRLPRRARLRMIERRNEAVLSLGKDFVALADAMRAAPHAMEC